MIETYVFWNVHESQQGVYDWTPGTMADLPGFLQTAADVGLFVNLRFGPYACAEWNFGGIPSWMKFIPGITFRTNSTQWLEPMKRFVTAAAEVIEPYLARNGGPIIMAQIENEYGNLEDAYGAGGKEYVKEVAQFARQLQLDVPWIMCQQADAPEDIINTCKSEE